MPSTSIDTQKTILLKYKGYKDKLEKLDTQGQVENKTAKNEWKFKNINSYAVNGAVHYANAILHHTNYADIIAVGVTGWKDEFGTLQHFIQNSSIVQSVRPLL